MTAGQGIRRDRKDPLPREARGCGLKDPARPGICP